MQTDKERFPGLVVNFRKAIYDQLKSANPDGRYIPTTAALRQAAFAASTELFEAETDPVSWRLAVNVWNAVMLTNESAFHQTMQREIEAGTLAGIKMVKSAKAVAQGYND